MIVTTNWNTYELEALGPRLYLAIHGSLLKSDTIYLPSETSVDFSLTRDQSVYSGAIHYEAILALQKSSLIVFWGLGINALDIEVTILLTEAFKAKNKLGEKYKVMIFDKEPDRVAARLESFGIKGASIEKVKV